MSNENIGSSFDDMLKEDGMYEEVNLLAELKIKKTRELRSLFQKLTRGDYDFKCDIYGNYKARKTFQAQP